MKKMVGDLNALVTNASPPCTKSISSTRASSGSTATARDDSVLAYIRKGKDPSDFLVVVCNFTPVVREKLSDRRAPRRLVQGSLQQRLASSTAAATSATSPASRPKNPAGTCGPTS